MIEFIAQWISEPVTGARLMAFFFGCLIAEGIKRIVVLIIKGR